jgi:D-tyrosyl-tRNA(Tyr) deacylase
MRAVIQRVKSASVNIGPSTAGQIGPGLLVFLGIEEADDAEDIRWLSAKLVQLRIFDDNEGVMNRSVVEIGGDVLLVSQFTLHASTRKGNRPSYIRAARPESAITLYEAMLAQVGRDLGKTVQAGVFGADMQVALVNDGPVTILIDTKNKE